jgi:hypothetical protein
LVHEKKLKGRSLVEGKDFYQCFLNSWARFHLIWFCGPLSIGIDGQGVVFWWKKDILSKALNWSGF